MVSVHLSDAAGSAPRSSALRGLARQALRFAPGALVPAVVGIVSSAIFTRIFGSQEYGQYALASSTAQLVIAIAGQWLQQSVTRYVPGENNQALLQRIRGAVAVSLILLSAGIPIISIIGLRTTSRWLAPGMFFPVVALVVSGLWFNALSTVLQAEMRASRYSAYRIAYAVLSMVGSLAMVVLAARHPSSLIWGPSVAGALLLPFLWKECHLPSAAWILANVTSLLRETKRLAGYGVPLVGWFVAAKVLDVGDRFLIEAFRGPGEVGVYAANYQLVAGSAGLIAAPIMLAAHPFLIRAWRQGDREQAGKWLGKISDTYIVFGLVLVGWATVFARDVVMMLVGPAFRDGYRVIPPVIAGIVLWQLGMYAHKPLEFIGRTKSMLLLASGSACVNFVLNVLLIPRYGYMAAGYTTCVSYGLYTISAAIVGRTVMPWHVDVRMLISELIIAAGGFGSAAIVRFHLDYRLPWITAVLASAGIATATTILMGWRALASSGRKSQPLVQSG
jgi:O-antigen/teichoic acid export membrane protein